MSKLEKLIDKLKNETITAGELRTLLKQLGWFLDRTKGSHEQWIGPNGQRFTIAAHSKDLKKYQIREAKEKAL